MLPENTKKPLAFWHFQGFMKWEHWPEISEWVFVIVFSKVNIFNFFDTKLFGAFNQTLKSSMISEKSFSNSLKWTIIFKLYFL